MALVWFVLLVLVTGVANAEDQKVAIAIHGGAGTLERVNMDPDKASQYRRFLEELVSDGHKQLTEGHSGLDVVVDIIQKMEDSPLFNAGRGAVLTWEGNHELDASIMHGGNLDAGAVAGVTTVRSPIALARSVMESSPHVMLSREGAEAFAAEQGFEVVEPGYFETDTSLEALKDFRRDSAASVSPDSAHKFGTVGVVVLDAQGHLSAGTSTGGMTGKRWGRIGDSPVIGAGTYADDRSCAVSATGHGEFFIRYAVAHDICARVRYGGASLAEAANAVVLDELVQAGGLGGVIAMNPAGEIVFSFNTPNMIRAGIDTKGNKQVALFGDE
jgi:beta-aspartyl-peptidase (threonine type)